MFMARYAVHKQKDVNTIMKLEVYQLIKGGSVQ